MDINTEPVGMGSRYIKRLDATMFAEMVLGNTRVECIGRERILTFDQAKIISRNKQMQKTAHVANAAVTSSSLNCSWRVDFELHGATMAATFVRCHTAPLIQTAIWLLAGIA